MNKLKIAALVMFTMSATSSFAAGTHKAPLKVDFNQLIDEGNIDRAELSKPVAEVAPARKEASTQSRRKVIDFIDMEVSVGAESSVVDTN